MVVKHSVGLIPLKTESADPYMKARYDAEPLTAKPLPLIQGTTDAHVYINARHFVDLFMYVCFLLLFLLVEGLGGVLEKRSVLEFLPMMSESQATTMVNPLYQHQSHVSYR